MSRKSAIIVIVLALILIAGGLFGYYYFFLRQTDGVPSGISKTISDYFPFGEPSAPPITPTNDTATPDQGGGQDTSITPTTPSGTVAHLRLVAPGPVAGAYIYDTRVSIETSGVKEMFDKTYIRYVDRGTGHISETATDSTSVKKISNTTIPKVYEALWGTNKSVVFRYAEDPEYVRNYLAFPLASTSDPLPALNGTPLNAGLVSVSFSPSRDTLFYLQQNGTGVDGIVWKIGETKRVNLFSSSIHEWTTEWQSPTNISLTTKPSHSALGFMYFLNPTTGAMKKIIGGMLGLTTHSDWTGTNVLFSKVESEIFSFYSLNTKTGAQQLLNHPTLPEKCVWSRKQMEIAYCAVPMSIPVGKYPDDWYMGKVSFIDAIWKVNTRTGEFTELSLSEKEAPKKLDAVNLMLNERESTLIFTNKIDGSLWSLDLSSN